MNASDYIQLSIALVAGIAAILTAINIFFTNKQVKLQKKQWEFSYVPIFRISYINSVNGGIEFVLKNTNEVYYEVVEITFSSTDVEVKDIYNDAVREFQEVHEGLIVRLSPKERGYLIGYLQLVGRDALGNEFKVNSKAIEFKFYGVKNGKILNGTYLKKIKEV